MTESPRPGVLLDIDGTLLDTTYLHTLAWSRAFRENGRTVGMAAIHRSIGIASDGLVRTLLGDDVHPDVLGAIVEGHSAHYASMREEVVAFDRAAELIRALRGRGLAVVLATSGAKSDLEWMMPAIGAQDAVTGTTTSADVDAGKPAPDILTEAMSAHGLDPRRTITVGDTRWDIESAAKAGIGAVALISGGMARADLLDDGALAVYDDVADLLANLDSSPLASLT